MTSPGSGPGQITYETTPPPEMTYEEYLAASAALSAWLSAYVLSASAPFQSIPLTHQDWLQYLATIYPAVELIRREQADLARRFYDSERAKHIGPEVIDIIPDVEFELPVLFETPFRQKVWPRLNINLPPYEPDWFEDAMDAVVLEFRKPDTPDTAVARTISTAVKEAENGGRKAIMWAVEDDPKVKGWARVEGNENVGSCAFCAMLISRGPVYRHADTAGLDVFGSDMLAVEAFRQAQASSNLIPQDLMVQWHPNCDCKVVPVFDYRNWPGHDQYIAMTALWKEVMRDFEDEHGRPPKQGKVNNPGTREALNAFRRRLERGEIPSNITRPRFAA